MSKEANSTERALKLAQKWQQTDWNTESPMSADFAVSEANDVISALIDALQEALNAPLAKPDFWEGYVPEPDNTCSNALRAQGKAYPRTCKKCGLGPCVELAQQALDKKAENARELGLDYGPAQDSGIVTAGGFDPRTQRTWVGLTDEEIERVCVPLGAAMLSFTEVARAIEAKLKERNT